MEQETVGAAHVAASSFPKAAKMVRDSLAREGLSIVAESSAGLLSRTLYVVCPFLLLETLAFDQSAAVFVPAHVVLSPATAGADVRWLNPAAFHPARIAAGAARPVNALHARIGSAIGSLKERNRPFLLGAIQRSRKG
jgi:hypothetical protein